jgi:N utilization substance protein B
MTSAQKHPPRGKRHGGRRRALELLYALEFNGLPFARGETEYLGGSARRRKGWSDFAHRLASGAFERRAELDAEISGKLRAWKIERLALIDRLLLRLALTELREEAEIPLRSR